MALRATAQSHARNVEAATVEAKLFHEVRPLGVPVRAWSNVNGLLVDPPTCAGDDTDDDSVKCPRCARAFRKHGA
eukprot:5949719-Pyramimonas_sp.AAC.1